MINGGAGTGKTILAVYLAKLLISGIDSEDFKTENDLNVHNLREILKSNSVSKGEIKIAFVVSMSNFRTTLKSVFKGIKELSAGMVMSPSEVANSKDDFDILIIDEAHRLKRKNAVTQREHRSFRNHNKALGLGDDGTQLDWLIAKSKYQILFYDKGQTVRPADIPKDVFEELSAKEENHTYFLTTQKRCLLGGNKYINYVDAIFSENPPKEKISFKEYELKLFNNVDEMVNEIKSKDDEYGLCRNIAGFAWEWKTKNKLMPKTHQSKDKMKEIIDGVDYDIDIDGYKYIWNVADKDWINSPNAVNEIGSIHTSQGYDLNYTGLIIGNELKYDWVNKKLIIDRSEYKDIKGKTRINDNELYGYVLNIYRTMMKRGCRGTYIYACDEGLREYLKQYIEEK